MKVIPDRPYTTLNDVLAETKNREAYLDDHFIECINQASRWVEVYIRRELYPTTYTEENPLVIPLSEFYKRKHLLDAPAQSITKVSLRYPEITDRELGFLSRKGDRVLYLNHCSYLGWALGGFKGTSPDGISLSGSHGQGDSYGYGELNGGWLADRYPDYHDYAKEWTDILVEGQIGYALQEECDCDCSESDKVFIAEHLPPKDLPSAIRRATTLIASAFSGEMHKQMISLDGQRAEVLDTSIPSEVFKMLKPFRARSKQTF